MRPARSHENAVRRSRVLVAALLVTGACGSRMDRQEIQAAERAGLTTQLAAPSPQPA